MKFIGWREPSYRSSGLIGLSPMHHDHYWKSYDFTRKNIDRDVLRKPLGPPGVLSKEIAGKSAFQHDGGEIIFNLPNGIASWFT